MIQETIYLKFPLRSIVNEKTIYVKDIGTVYCIDKIICKTVEDITLLKLNSNQAMQYAYSILMVISKITEIYPNCTVVNLGEEDFLIDYKKKKQEKKTLEYAKTVFVALIIFFGAAFSIMTFNTDVSVQDVFANVYQFITGEQTHKKGILELAYCVGLPVGILVFFNHFSSKKVLRDPTPIQIEMRKYEKDVENAMLSNAEREGKTIEFTRK
ncbi:stage V sporulation protein AA [Anaerosporobacter faecicola]|uniref:stage V sporulation protein AA n=1 Tax=Anaerosporobacter faecicola TaxID=2718714 RepID=UPI00143BC0F5|nr:stage V sporulation protein AA [Anaerosporobacter faecicola]